MVTTILRLVVSVDCGKFEWDEKHVDGCLTKGVTGGSKLLFF